MFGTRSSRRHRGECGADREDRADVSGAEPADRAARASALATAAGVCVEDVVADLDGLFRYYCHPRRDGEVQSSRRAVRSVMSDSMTQVLRDLFVVASLARQAR